MNNLTRRAFIVAASMLPQAGAIEMAAQNLPNPGAGKGKGRFSLLPAAPAAGEGTSAADQEAALIQEVVKRVPAHARLPEGTGMETGLHPAFHVHVY